MYEPIIEIQVKEMNCKNLSRIVVTSEVDLSTYRYLSTLKLLGIVLHIAECRSIFTKYQLRTSS
jgi:hypothetical protein